jgi:hypothetical protein
MKYIKSFSYAKIGWKQSLSGSISGNFIKSYAVRFSMIMGRYLLFYGQRLSLCEFTIKFE